MSVDFEVWSVESLRDKETFPRREEWQATGGGWQFTSKDWQILVEEPVPVDETDIPPEIGPHIVGVSYLTRVSLEPGHAPTAAHSLVRQVVRSLASTCRGVVFNPQDRMVTGASGRQRKFSPPKDEPIEILKLSWWFTDGPLTNQDGARELIAYFQAHLPQFLPKRYGGFEPPRFVFDPSDIESFLDFILRDRSAVWRCEGHLFDVHYSPRFGPGWNWLPGFGDYGFTVPSLSLSCPLRLLDEPGWEIALRRCSRTVSRLARPFYGDVRMLGGYRVRGNSLVSNPREVEEHPASGPWRGLPDTFGLAAVLGQPYLNLWPGFLADAERNDGLAFQSLATWRERGEVTGLTGAPPGSLCRPGEARWVEETLRMPDGSDVRLGHEEQPKGCAEVWPFPARPSAPPRG